MIVHSEGMGMSPRGADRNMPDVVTASAWRCPRSGCCSQVVRWKSREAGKPRPAVRARESQSPHNYDRMQGHQAGLTEANPAGNGVLSYCGQIRQITPVPGICTSGPLAAPTNLLSAPAWPKSRTAP